VSRPPVCVSQPQPDPKERESEDPDRRQVVHASRVYWLEALAPGRPLQTTRDVFSLLAAPTMDVHTSAGTLVRAVKIVALQDVKTTTGRVIRDGLEAMAITSQPSSVVQAMRRAVTAAPHTLRDRSHLVAERSGSARRVRACPPYRSMSFYGNPADVSLPPCIRRAAVSVCQFKARAGRAARVTRRASGDPRSPPARRCPRPRRGSRARLCAASR